MDAANQVWNRAAMANGGPAPREGDAALASVLGVHSMAMVKSRYVVYVA